MGVTFWGGGSDTPGMLACPSMFDFVELSTSAKGWTPETGGSFSASPGDRGTVVDLSCPRGLVAVELEDGIVEVPRGTVTIVRAAA